MNVTKTVITKYYFGDRDCANSPQFVMDAVAVLKKAGVILENTTIDTTDPYLLEVTSVTHKTYNKSNIHKMEA